MAVNIRKVLVRVDLSKLSKNQFRERKPGTFHIGNRFIPFHQFSEFAPALQGCNSLKTVEYMSNMFILLNTYNGKKEIFEEIFSMPVFIIKKA